MLDTHVIVWWLTDDRKLRKEHARLLDKNERANVPVAISAITLWEIAKLVERGRLELTQSVDECLDDLESNALVTVLPLTARIATESSRLGVRFPTDPIDQIIAATARCNSLILLTVDQRIIDSGVVAIA